MPVVRSRLVRAKVFNAGKRRSYGADIYFEQTKPSFRVAPLVVKRMGGLSSRWETTSLHRIEPDDEGFYLAYNGHRRPHFMEPFNRRKDVKNLATSKGIECINIDARCDSGYHLKDDLLVLNSNDAAFIGANNGLELHLEELFLELYDSWSVSDRGNVGRGAGYANLNQKIQEGREVTAPVILTGSTARDVERMIAMTTMLRRICKMKDIEMPFSNDSKRTDNFANYLCRHFGLNDKHMDDNKPRNVLEAVQFALTTMESPSTGEHVLFGNHVDQFNDAGKGFNVLMCAYYHFEYGGKFFRLALIGYSRNAIGAYYVQKDATNHLKRNLSSYIEHLTAGGRLSPDPKEVLRPPSNNNEPVHKVAHLDKIAGFYSTFAHAIRAILLSNRNKPTLELGCELLLPIAWVTTSDCLYPIYREWAARGVPPDGNCNIAFIRRMVLEHGAVTSGKGARFQPSFNFSIMASNVSNGLNILLSVIQDINQGQYLAGDIRVYRRLKEIVGVGDLGSLHLIAIAALAGFIDASWAATAHVCKGTFTWKKLTTSYQLGECMVNKIIADLAHQFGYTQATIENALCEFFRDCEAGMLFDSKHYKSALESRGLKRPDIFHPGQTIYCVKQREVVEWQLTSSEPAPPKRQRLSTDPSVEYYIVAYDYNGVEEEIASTALLQSEPAQNWSSTGDFEVKVSKSSKLRSAAKCRTHKVQLARKRVVHTGIGVHPGLEDKLIESDQQKWHDDEYQAQFLELRDDPSVKIYLGDKVERVQLLASNSRQTRFGSPSLNLVLEACKDNGTYRYIDTKGLCIKLLANERKFPKKLNCGRIKRYFSFPATRLADNSGPPVYTGEIHFTRNSFLTISGTATPALFDTELAGYHGNRAYYFTKAAAEKAIVVRTLVEVGCSWESGDDDPEWARVILPTELHKVAVPSLDYVVLYQNGKAGGSGDKMFGVLQFRGGSRVLSIPPDLDDLTRPWQDFFFRDYERCGWLKASNSV